jgi:tetratricopeptide (TPR) repeat protein
MVQSVTKENGMTKTLTLKNCGFLLIVFCIMLTISCQHNLKCEDLTKKYFLIMEGLRTKRDTVQFVKDLEHIIDRNPKCLKALQLRGYLLMEQADFKAAKKYFIPAAKIDDANPFTLYYLSLLYNMAGDNDSSFYFLSKAINLKNKNGKIIEDNNLFSNKLDIEYVYLIHLRGIIFFETNYFSAAKHDFLYCIQEGKENDDTDGYLAAVYSRENNLDSACMFYRRSIVNGRNYIFDSSLDSKCK